jgi:cholesterol oxidase
VIAASGVGGGSLVYSNVTLEPPETVYKQWPTQRSGRSLKEYFEPARNFIGVNRITTISGLGPKNTKLEKSRIFQEAADKVRRNQKTVLNPLPEPPDSDPDLGFAIYLSITDVPDGVFKNLTPELIAKYQSPIQTNVCQRQGRCNLGCLPGARHTLNKRIVKALQSFGDLLDVRPLCEAYLVEFIEPDLYKVRYRQYNQKGEVIGQENVLLTKRFVVSAGTLGTNELLLKSRDKGLKISKRLGEGFSPNGDLFGFMSLSKKRIDITRGPINTCHALFSKEPGKDFVFSIEDTTISKMVAPFFAILFELVSLRGERG